MVNGTSLCRGQYLAVAETLCMVALLISRFDLMPESAREGSGNL